MLGGTTPSGYGAGKVDIGINILLRGKGVYYYDVRGGKGRNRMIPFVMRRRRVDEYGGVVRADEYMRAEERAEEDLLGAIGVTEERVIGKKRKWDENDAKRGGPAARKGKETGDVDKKQNKSKTKDRPDWDESCEPEDGEQEEEEESEVEEGEAEDEESMLTVPSKITSTKIAILMLFKVAFIDFAGLHDSRILRMLLPLISPRKLILVGNREQETNSLASDYRKLLSG